MKTIIKTVLLFFILIIRIFGITIVKELQYDRYTLPIEYKYLKEKREIQLEKIAEKIQLLNNLELEKNEKKGKFGILRNYKNINGVPEKAFETTIDKYNIERDKHGNMRYQGIPLYRGIGEEIPLRYGLDGELILILAVEQNKVRAKLLDSDEEWYIPINYVKSIGVGEFRKIVVIDRKNQNVLTMEKESKEKWKVRSINPVSTGRNHPPFSFITPLGTFVFQDKLEKMNYLKDGSKTELEGYAPYASRFTGGVYIHGIPVNLPKTEIIEYSDYLGTFPRSHKCIRSASSHAEFVYNWGPVYQTAVFVIE